MKLHTSVTSDDYNAVIDEIDGLVRELQSELVELSKKISTTQGGLAQPAIVNSLSNSSFLEVVDMLHKQSEYLPEASRCLLKPMLAGIEDLYSMTAGFVAKLSPSMAEKVVSFDVVNRFNERSVGVSLTPLSWQFLSRDLRKEIRDLKRNAKHVLIG